MASCDLTIELEDAGGMYRGGDIVRGVIVVEASARVRCDGLRVGIGWRVHGRGNRHVQMEQEADLFTGEWYERERHRYPFSFTLPDSPVSYRGNVLNIDWFVWTRADIPWRFDPKAERELVVKRAGPVTLRGATVSGLSIDDLPPQALQVMQALPALQTGGKAVLGCGGVLVGTVFTLIGLGFAIGEGAIEPLLLAAFGMAAVGFGGRAVYQGVRKLMAAQRFSAIQIEPRGTFTPGEPGEVTVTLTTKSRVQLVNVRLMLICQERATSGSGTNTHTHTHDVVVLTEPIFGTGAVPAGQTRTASVSFTAPEDVMHSFSAPNNRIQWLARLDIQMGGSPEVVREALFQMR